MSISDRIAIMNRGRLEQVDVPRAIYERPATLLVGGFVGQRSVLEGALAGRKRERLVFGGAAAGRVQPSAG